MEKFEYANEILKNSVSMWDARFKKFCKEITENSWSGKNGNSLLDNIRELSELTNQSKMIMLNQQKMISDLIEAQKEF